MMQAIVVERSGGPEVLGLAERDELDPAPDGLVVTVAAAGVNYMDVYQREGRPPYAPQVPFVPGAEGAGTVSAVGSEVSGVAVGDRVAWAGVPGSYAEQVAVPAARAVAVPAGVDDTTAAAVMLQGLTAHYLATSTYPVAAGDVVVVHAAAGGVGLLLTQIVVRRGGTVIATSSTGAKAELASAAGASHVCGYDELADVVSRVTDGEGVAAVYDGVGAATFDTSLAALRRRGTMVLYGGASGPVPPLELQRLSGSGSLFITRPTMTDYVVGEELHRRADELLGWVAAGELDVRVGGRYPLAEAARAHTDLESRGTTGKLVLLP